jgi:hypothetical protein
MNEVYRSLVGGGRSRTVRAGRVTLIILTLMFAWLLLGWMLAHVAIQQ